MFKGCVLMLALEKNVIICLICDFAILLLKLMQH